MRKELKFSGELVSKDPYRCSDDQEDGSVWIGGEDVVASLPESMPGCVVVIRVVGSEIDAVNVAGDGRSETGWGYSEYTPMDADTWRVGNADVLERFNEIPDGSTVELCVSWDEP